MISGNYREFSPQKAVGIIGTGGTKGEKYGYESGYNLAFAWRTSMRIAVLLLSVFMLSGCTAMMVGGAAAAGYQLGKDEREPAVVAADSAITAKIKGKYVADSVVSVFNIGVRTYEGTVTLTGNVGSYVARDQAVILARSTSGVKAVNNQIIVED
jgi:osmotically-inducible protein OsmY